MDYARSFVYRANEDHNYFFGKTRLDGTPEPEEMKFSENRQFGNIWKGMDCAYRVVSNPKLRARALADLDAWPNVDVTDKHRQLLLAVLDKLATRQDADALTDVEYDDGFWQAFLTEYVDWIRTGICQELIDDAFN